jgi:NAD(P)-dependent dehydrogenase (short-subunit alcohol dehydrogenase family)
MAELSNDGAITRSESPAASGDLRFDGRVAIVTGAGGNPGIGRSYALLLAERGAKVVVNDLGVGPDGRGQIGPGAEAVVAEIQEHGGAAIANYASVAERDSARSIVQAALETFGRIDIVINNAGIAPFALFDEIADRDIQRVIGVHLMGPIWMCRAAWPFMKQQKYGRIVNVSSGVAVSGLPHQSIYAGGKLGVFGLTRVLAAEGASYNIRANVIFPSADTLAWQTMMPAEFSRAAQDANMIPGLVAPVGAWLAHEACSFSGRGIEAKSGSVSEVRLFTTTPTPDNPDLTIEQARDACPSGADREHGQFVPDPSGSLQSVPLPYQDQPREPKPGSPA